MVKLKIDNKDIEVSAGTTVLKAAESVGIHIPSMCYLDGCSNHPTCMVCMVKDTQTGKMMPSCATKVVDGMNLASEDAEVFEARKEAVELLLSDHVGDCEAPCRVACPAFMDIPKMNRFIAQGKFDEALEIVKEEIALPHILGHICSAPCEKVCRRKDVDEAVSICILKRTSAEKSENTYLPEVDKASSKKVAIIGSGVAGLAASYHILRAGHKCTLFEKESVIGGMLQTAITKDEMPQEVLDSEIEILQKLGLEIKLNSPVNSDNFESIREEYDAVIIASGSDSDEIAKLNLDFKGEKEAFKTNLPDVFAGGSLVRLQKMAVKALAQGKELAHSVNQSLNGQEIKASKRKFNSRFGVLRQTEALEYLKESVEGNRKEIKNTAGAMAEAARCLHCDCRKIDNCKLRDCAETYQADRRKFLMGDRETLKKHFNHESIVYEPEKCIKCGLCVEIAQRNKELTGLTFIGRGFDVEMAVPFNQNISVALTQTAHKCAEVCPTGALALK
ncbi:2Fe-2S iron-sulfur cluster-binding protein [Ancylomarina sp. DW003]|nr:2Fe-2S iron-sulfur cluster-binding protein [Ancylomarina sp. DW003]MDE5423265.1 2Fe-2S iron-sulfur cluster-binding protein [Ancylomarina sp. DW003]